MRVLGGTIQAVYDATNDDNYKKIFGSATPVYIMGSGEIGGGIVPPYVPTDIPIDTILVSQTNWIGVDASDYLRYE